MAILEKEVWVKIEGRNYKYYENLGYIIPIYTNKNGKLRIKIGEKILVKLKDVPNGSNVRVTKICDICGKHIENQTYSNIFRQREKNDGKDRCQKCKNQNNWDRRYANLPYEKTFEYYAKYNNMENLLNEYSNKNNKKPNEISYGSNFKCLWNCSNCKGEYITELSNRTCSGGNCPYCSGLKVLKGFNDLWTTRPDIAILLKNKEIGYKINAGSNKKVEFTCPNCGYSKKKQVSNVVIRGFSCSRCSDGISYPEKFMISVLDQLDVKFENQKTFEWSKKIYHLKPKYKNLSGNKKYDFYILSLNMIIETHGKQHYAVSFEKIGGRNVDEETENDDLKMYLAYNNGIKKYIIIDCRNSDLEWIKNSIMNSKLGKIFDLSKIDWLKCHEFACNTLVKVACNLWNSSKMTTLEIGNEMNLSRVTIIRYLNQGVELGWCNYNGKEIMKQNSSKNGKLNKRKIVQLSINNKFIKEWESIDDAQIELNINNVSAACRGVRKKAGGFCWMYLEQYEQQISKTL